MIKSLVTSQVEIVKPEPEHVDAVYVMRQQLAHMRHNPLRAMSKSDFSVGYLESGSDLADWESCPIFRWTVLWNGEPVGSVSLKDISTMMLTGEIGYGIDERFHGKGIATEAVRLLVAKVFQETPLRKITALIHDQNTSSCRLVEKLGFIREGLLREQFLIQGEPVNELFYGLLRSEWKVDGKFES